MKPILFHDIDGVLFGEYDGEFQLRPGVKTWLRWAHEHFQVVFLTSWSPEKIRTLLSVIYSEKFIKNLSEELKLPKERCIQVSGKGAGALTDTRRSLEELRDPRIQARSISIAPMDWKLIGLRHIRCCTGPILLST